MTVAVMLLAEMTSAHFIYIPGVLVLGVVIGYLLGGKAAQTQRLEQEDRQRRRDARRARRQR